MHIWWTFEDGVKYSRRGRSESAPAARTHVTMDHPECFVDSRASNISTCRHLFVKPTCSWDNPPCLRSHGALSAMVVQVIALLFADVVRPLSKVGKTWGPATETWVKCSDASSTDSIRGRRDRAGCLDSHRERKRLQPHHLPVLDLLDHVATTCRRRRAVQRAAAASIAVRVSGPPRVEARPQSLRYVALLPQHARHHLHPRCIYDRPRAV